jgi:hypothetical protein
LPTRLKIDCANKDDRLDPYARIRRVGGPNLPGMEAPNGSKLMAELRRRGLPIVARRRWTLAIDEAVRGAVEGQWSFYIDFGMYDEVNVEVATSPSGQLYLKPEIDQDTPDQLLVLPECRWE